MNLRQKWTCFWTVKSKAKEGFTLVELIVVIAILAILGGVAVPAYNGYVDKAKRSGDETLLAAVNKAFASACLANSTDIYLVDEASATVANKAVTAVAPYNDEFFQFFEGNETEKFQIIESLIFDADKHMFVDPANATEVTLAYNGAKVTVTGAQIQALKDSTYFGEGMTSAKLLNQVDGAALVAGGLGTIANIQNTPEFVTFAANALGLDDPTKLADELFILANEALNGSYTSYDDVPDELTAEYDAMMAQIKNNAMVLYTAQQTTNLGIDEASKLLEGVGTNDNFAYDVIQKNMQSSDSQDKQTGLTQAALAYGMYYAYVNSDACEIENVEKDNILPLDVINALNTDTAFQAYIKSSQGEKDMKAYLEALSIVDDGAKTPGAVGELVTNGFGDLTGLLEGVMGK